MSYKSVSSYNNPSCPNPCAPAVYSKVSSAFGGNNNMPGSMNTAAFRYAQLVSLAHRGRRSGTVVFVNNTNEALKVVQPPRNTF
jgi:hypothetical protein